MKLASMVQLGFLKLLHVVYWHKVLHRAYRRVFNYSCFAMGSVADGIKTKDGRLMSADEYEVGMP